MTSVFLISSAAYVDPELEAEFGRLPPAFLPLGNRRLFVHQRAALGDAPTRLLLSLPDDFEPEPHDQAHLVELGTFLARLGVTHRPELDQLEGLAAPAGALLPEEHR